ncbi:ATP-dependent metallopeptidase Hfl [Trichodelitschia bisporula]|uniref:ATP-dependent metallopeptidase Hfl n=1 Tax=Trichodelitschia bisporula TaxID=703511 RepID=A0A6G1HYW9_9PEZI|nr:ATP-dependent metallopeptidase Hfl [Trichodelitschia bisporula]
MALQSPVAVQAFASVTSEVLPSLSTAFHSPWRTLGRPSPPSTSRSNSVSQARQSPNIKMLEGRMLSTISRNGGSRAASTSVATALPDCRVSVPAASFSPQTADRVFQSAPTAVGLLSSAPRHVFRRANSLQPRVFLRPQRAQYSVLSRTTSSKITTMIPMGPGSAMQRRMFWGSNTSYNHLARMEQTANNNPGSASAQNAFYSALLRANRPDLVVQRYETGRVASNPACEQLYLRALEQLGAVDQSEGANTSVAAAPEQQQTNLNAVQYATAQAIGARARGANLAIEKGNTGARGSPIHVVVEETVGSHLFKWVKFCFWYIFAGWAFYVIVSFLIESTGILKRVSTQTNAEAKPELQTTKFTDVHGCEEAKEELQELVEFLKSPDKFSTLGGKLPKGVLLVGPPGTGKTLLARAVAGEAGVPFFYMSGSEFDEVYVGVGAKRVRELFAAARAKAPAIVFIDELDAIGGKRNERDAAYVKQTLNQLLTDLDGFDNNSGVIFLAATNFPELLDKALTRPGRFDRRVVVPLPDVRGRVSILKHHTKKMQIGTDVDVSILARGTPGFSGAELENLANQAAVHASKRKATKINMTDFEWAKDKILMGAERRSAVIQHKDKVMTAYHEGGHALVALFTPRADPLYKATIMPRGHALGITFQLPELDRVSMAKNEYLARIDVCMGGKVAEEMIYGAENVTSGASSDIQQATAIAYAMVTQMGMSDRLGNLDLHSDYARLPANTKQEIWEEVRRLVEEGKKRAQDLLTSKRKELDLLASALVEYETLGKEEIEKAIRGEKLPDRLTSGIDSPIKMPEVPISALPPATPPLPSPPGGPVAEPSPVPGGGEPPRPYPAGG